MTNRASFLSVQSPFFKEEEKSKELLNEVYKKGIQRGMERCFYLSESCLIRPEFDDRLIHMNAGITMVKNSIKEMIKILDRNFNV